MTNYDQMKNLIEAFGDKYNQHICMESSLSIVSEDKDNSKIQEKFNLYIMERLICQ